MNIDEINYTLDNPYNKDKTIVLLHGWGQNISMMEPLKAPLVKICQVLIVDLPGFGKSKKPDCACQLSDYVEVLNKLFKKLNIKNPIILGHSFGGRLALMYASLYQVDKLILCASPFEVHNKNDSLKLRSLKKLKHVKILKPLENKVKSLIGSRDYKAADPTMRKILVNTVNTDLTEYAKKITVPTILIWGDNDLEATIDEGHRLERLIEDAALIVYPNLTHYAYLEDLPKTISIITNFIKGSETK